MAADSPGLIELLNRVTAPARVMFHCVPTRIVRVTAMDDSFKTFRVEQLVVTGGDSVAPIGNWKTLSTHGSQVLGQSYTPAAEAAHKAQAEITRRLTERAKGQRVVRP